MDEEYASSMSRNSAKFQNSDNTVSFPVSEALSYCRPRENEGRQSAYDVHDFNVNFAMLNLQRFKSCTITNNIPDAADNTVAAIITTISLQMKWQHTPGIGSGPKCCPLHFLQ